MNYTELEFEKDSVFLVTGGAGFIGSNLCEAILKMGYKVRCLDNFSTGFMHNLEDFINHENFELIEGDITNLEICKKATKGVNFVLHQAAWGSVPRSIEMPLFYEEVNIKGTLNMLEASRINEIEKFVYASSSSVYGDEPSLPKKEGEEGNVLSPYALTKKTNEGYAKLYSDLYGLDTYGMRYFNVFGRRQNPEGNYSAVIPKFIKLIINNEQPTINGDGKQSRDFTYIDNVIQANLKACKAEKIHSGKAFNIATGGRIYLNEILDQIKKILGKMNIEPLYTQDRVGDIKHSNASIKKATLCLNYHPTHTFEEGLNETISWYFLKK